MRLFLNDIEIELKGVKIRQNYQINNLAELKDRQSNYTNKFKVYKTPKNIKAFNYLGVKGNNSRTPYVKLPARLIVGNKELINGTAQVIGNKGDYFDVALYSGNIALYQEVGNKKLNELNLSDLSHGVSSVNFTASFANTSGYIYAISDFGRFDPTNKIEINYQLPSVYAHTLWDKIFNEAGFSYQGDIFTSPKFKSLVITPKRGYNSELDTINPSLIIDTTSSDSNQHIAGGGWGICFDHTLMFNFPDGITIQETGNYRFVLDTTVNYFGIGNFKHIFIKKNATTIGVYNDFNYGAMMFTSNIDVNLSLNAGDVITMGIVYEACDTIITKSVSTVNTLKVYKDGTYLDFNFNSFIGEMPQKTFIKDVMQHFGLILQKQQRGNVYDFVQISSLINDKQNAIDWSDKFIREVKEVNKLSSYAQHNRFAYNYLESDSEPFADGFLDINNENLADEKTSFTRPYNAPTFSDETLNAQLITYTPFWKIERNDDGTIKSYKPMQSKNYLAEVKKVNTTINYGLSNAVNNSFTGDVPVLDFSYLNYQQIINENYLELKDVLDWNTVKTVELLLDENDIENLNFLKPYYFSQLGSYFILNKVKGFTEKGNTQCEIVMIKHVERENSIGEYNEDYNNDYN